MISDQELQYTDQIEGSGGTDEESLEFDGAGPPSAGQCFVAAVWKSTVCLKHFWP